MSVIHRLRNVPIGALTGVNAVVMLSGWFLSLKGIAPTDPATQRYSPEVQLVGLGIGLLLPYLIVKKEDSGHGFAYCFAYAVLVVFLWIDLDALVRWLALH
jgi:hypothetical protein